MRRFVTVFVIGAATALAILTKTDAPAFAASSTIVISQVYGGGGNASAPLQNDFVELFNRSSAPVSLNGWSVQYASTAGTSWQRTNLSGVTLQPGQYYLVQEAAGTSCSGAACGSLLPTPDVTGTIAMALGAGKVALVSSTTTLSGSCPTAGVIDFVGFGSGTNCFEGSGPTATLSNTAAAIRGGGGCTDTDANSVDFSTAAPAPRNTASPTNGCGLPSNPTASGAANPSTLLAGSQTLLIVTVTPGANPVSTGLTVTTDLTAIGGSATQAFAENGGNAFSFLATVAASTAPGAKSLPVTIADAQSRTGTATISLTVNAPTTPPTAAGAASPNMLLAGAATDLTVTVTSGTNPSSASYTVTGDLSAIGGSASQSFASVGGSVFSFNAIVTNSTTPGAKSLPITVVDDQARSASTSIALTVVPPPPPTTIKISQVYGGGGNSGATYTNDFIELFNGDVAAIDVTGWSVQYTGATNSGAWAVTPICPTGPCVVPPGAYFLVQESAGAGGTTPLPPPNAVGAIAMSLASGKVAVTNSTIPIAGTCPIAGTYADFVGFGAANCAETAPTPVLTNFTAAVRRGNGCQDTDNNSADFVAVGPIPRNSLAPANGCGGNASKPSGVGIATPDSIDPASNTLLTIRVAPATAPPSTGISVVGNLSSIGGSSAQTFYDDGTHGDQIAGDNVFSLLQTTAADLTTGAKYIPASVTDQEGRTAPAPITLTITSPTCGVERWSVKVGSDSSVGLVRLDLPPTPATILDLVSAAAPPESAIEGTPPGPYAFTRDPVDAALGSAVETTVYVIDATMTFYKKETDVDYHIVLTDNATPTPHTLIAEIPNPACIIRQDPPRLLVPSPLAAGIANAREKFDARLAATTDFQTANIPVRVKGVGFWDFLHGQTGVAPNAIELHPVLDIFFRANTTTTLLSTGTPTYGLPLTFTATVTNGGENTPTGDVTFFDSVTGSSRTATLDANGQATFTSAAFDAGPHSLVASYPGDDTSLPSASAPLSLTVAKASQSIDFAPLPDRTFGDPSFTVSATGGASGNPVTFAVSGACTSSGVEGGTITPTTAGSCTVTASQAGNVNYEAAADVSRSFTIVDRTPPVIASVTPSVASIWPPNRQMIGVSIAVSVIDNVDAAPSCRVTSIGSNEPKAGDSAIAGQLTVNLLADRSGGGSGRVYTIGVQCVDAAGNVSTATTVVAVPHDQRR